MVLFSGFVAMVIAACVINFQRALALLVLTLAAMFFLGWDWLMDRYGSQLWKSLEPAKSALNNQCIWMR